MKIEFKRHQAASEITPVINDWWARGYKFHATLYFPADGFAYRIVEREGHSLYALVQGRSRVALGGYHQSVVIEPGDEVETSKLLQNLIVSTGATVMLQGSKRPLGESGDWMESERRKLEAEVSKATPGRLDSDFVTRCKFAKPVQFETISNDWWERGYECDYFTFPSSLHEGPTLTYPSYCYDAQMLHAVIEGCVRFEIHTDKIERFDMGPGDEACVPAYYFKEPINLEAKPAVWVFGWPKRWRNLEGWLNEYYELRRRPVSGELLHPRISGLSSRYVESCSNREALKEFHSLFAENDGPWLEIDGRVMQTPLADAAKTRLEEL